MKAYTSRQIGHMKDRIYTERMSDIHGWFKEAITESSDKDFAEFHAAVLAGDHLHAGTVLDNMMTDYCTPTDQECIEALDEERL